MSTAPTEDAAEEMLTLTNAMVRIYKEQFGRGPTRSRSSYAGPDTIICTLERTMIPIETTMVRLGEHERLREMRSWFQHVIEPEFVSTVEHVTGRRVRAFVSGTDTANDVSAEVFYLEPLED